MNTKLTLKINKNIIEKAKAYAGKNNTSLSQMVEKYFIALVTDSKNEGITLTQTVKELSGVIKSGSADNYKKDYSDYLSEKYK